MGTITIKGGINSSTNAAAGTMTISSDVTLIVQGEIASTNSTSGGNIPTAINNNGGTVTISSGANVWKEATSGATIVNSTGTITISEGAIVSHAGTNPYNSPAVIFLTGGNLVMTGGTVTHTGTVSNIPVISNSSNGAVLIEGGEVRASNATRVAISRAASAGTVTVHIPPTVIFGTFSGDITVIEE